MFTFTSILEAGASASYLARGRLLANCVDTSFGTLDLDLFVRGPGRVVLHPSGEVFSCGVKWNLNPLTSGDCPTFSAGHRADGRITVHLNREVNPRVSLDGV